MAISSDFIVGGSGPLWTLLFGVGPALFLVAVWIVVAAILTLREDQVEKPNRMAQLYGYTVCLVALLVALLNVSSILNAAFERSNPLQSEYGFGAALTSFDAYVATYQREQRMFSPDRPLPPDTASTATLRQHYDALVEDRMAGVRYRTSKTFVTSGVLLALAGALFIFHWHWVRRLNGRAEAAA